MAALRAKGRRDARRVAGASTSPPVDPALGQALGFVLDQMPVGAVLVDGSGRVVWMNQSAVTLIRNGDGITLRDGRLGATRKEEAGALQRLIKHAIASRLGREARDPATIVLSRPSEAASLVVVVRPIDRLGARSAKRIAKAVVFVSEPEHDLRASRQRLRSIFNLTRAESDLVALLAEGHSLQSAASQLAVTNESARTYLKRAFTKTATRRQAELVRLALTAAIAGASDE